MWKKIKGFENYSINECGEVRNDSTNKIKNPYVNHKNNYLYVDLYKNNKGYKRPIHRLIAESFIPNTYNKPTVDHKDGNRQNNSINNLRWATYSEQNSRFGTNGVRSEKIKVTHYREERKKRGGGHVAWLDVDEIKFYDSISNVAEQFGVSISNISQLLKNGTIGKRGKTRGYLFEYCNGERKHCRKCVTTIETQD